MTVEIKIGDLAHPSKGSFKIGPFGSSLKKEDLQDFGIPVAGIENILPNQFVPRFRRFISAQKFSELADYEIKPNDILVSTMGTIGRAAIAPDKIGTVIIDSHLFRMRLDCSKVFPAYLCYAINGYDGLKRTLRQMARGAIMDGLNTSILKECSIPLFPLVEQKRIAAILDKVDRLRRQRRYAQTLSDSFLQSVFIKMFGDPVSNPRDWKFSVFESLLENIDSGFSPVCDESSRKTNEWAVLKLSAVTSGRFLPSENKVLPATVKPVPEYEVKKGDILFTRKNTEDLVAACALVHESIEGLLLPDTIFRFNLKADCTVRAEFIWGLFTNLKFRRTVQALATGSAGSMPNISKEKLNSLRIPLPSLPLQEQFAAIVQKFERIRRQQREATRQAEHLFQTLLHRAFRGEL